MFFFIITFLFITESKSKNCLTFLPYGFNDYYVHLPQDSSFCVKEGKDLIFYKTDNHGGRLVSSEKFSKEIQVFGDSQVLGLDVEKIDHHYLQQLYKNNFIIYAAPNNGPYEVINFLNKNRDILNKKIIINFNFSVDLYRVELEWDPNNFVALKDYELNEILDYPLKYNWIIFKNLLSNKNFTLKRYNNNKMQKLFLNKNHNKIQDNLVNYFYNLNKTAKSLDLEIDFIITKPYWIYSRKKNNKELSLEIEINKKVENLICNSFIRTQRINNIYISHISKKKLYLNDLTFDGRHFKSNIIKLVKKKQIC